MLFNLQSFVDSVTLMVVMIIILISRQIVKVNAKKQKLVPDQYAELASIGYIVGCASFFFACTMYFFSAPIALISLILSLIGLKSTTHRIRANWGLAFSVIGILAPAAIILTSMALSHCWGVPAFDCSIPLGISELFFWHP